jgi:essential nuclear protein 1
MFAATKVFASNFDNNGAIKFYKNYLLAAARNDIRKNKKLNYHYYQSIIKALYKTPAWF